MKQTESLSQDAINRFRNGTCSQAHEMMGGHLTDDGAWFRVWAPHAVSVSVIGSFNSWTADMHPMQEESSGIWYAFIPNVRQYDAYKYSLETKDGVVLEKADPYAFHAETRPHTASKLYALDGYEWHDDAWLSYRKTHLVYDHPLHIYEVHFGSWRQTENGEFLSYRDAAALLIPYVKEMGFTHVEFLPLTEHPLDDSWGYQCTGFFAATSRFGTPHDLKYLIDQCHQAGIGVILDWVPAHFPKDAHGLMEFDGSYCYEYAEPTIQEHAGWGTRVFDYGKGEVRSFLTSSARFWLEEYHIDGLRVDAVASMLYLDYGRPAGAWRPNRNGGRENLEAISLLQQINQTLFGLSPDVLMIAEESTAWPGVSHPVDVGGLGFNIKWNMGWMNDIFHYCKLDPYFRQFNHKDLTFSFMYAFSENFLLPVSHDEVVHMKGSLLEKMPGDLAAKMAGVRVFYAYMLAHPGKKLLFMGAEFGQAAEWNFANSLDWHLLEQPEHQALHAFFKAAGQFYLSQAPLWEIDFDWSGFSWLCADDHFGNTAAFLRNAKKGEPLIFLCNFSPVLREGYRLGVPEAGYYAERFHTDRMEFGGSSAPLAAPLSTEDVPCHGQGHSLKVDLPPLSAVFLQLTKRMPKKKAKKQPAKQTRQAGACPRPVSAPKPALDGEGHPEGHSLKGGNI
ncbi:MAG: 1,4-alpha-glucan branching protein GlgB [Oscillospiraceae bacterium]|jgi:1,4-alpha-glucan branching enzyme